MSLNDRLKNLKEVKTANVWQYEEAGDEIAGELIDIQTGQFGNNYIIKCVSGEEFTVFGGAVLNTKMSRIQKGKALKITYLGEVKSGSGRMYKDFKVETE